MMPNLAWFRVAILPVLACAALSGCASADGTSSDSSTGESSEAADTRTAHAASACSRHLPYCGKGTKFYRVSARISTIWKVRYVASKSRGHRHHYHVDVGNGAIDICHYDYDKQC